MKGEPMKKLLYSLSAILAMASALFAAPANVTGTLTKESGKFVMVDEATQNRFEIRGKGLEKLVGSHVNVTGELISGPTGSTPVVELTSVTRLAAATGKAAAPGIKMGVAKTTLLVAGAVAASGFVGGLYAADVIGGAESPASRP
jgi:hypothetical protein